MHYVESERISNIKSKSELPCGSGGAIYVWVSLQPQGKTPVYTNYVGQTSNIKSRLSSDSHTNKINGDMDVFIFNLSHSTENHRQVIERMVYEYLQWAGGDEYRTESLNDVKPLLPKVITQEMFSQSYEEFHKIANDLQYYLRIKNSSRDIPFLKYKSFLEWCQTKGKMAVIQPTIQTKGLTIYNPYKQDDYYQPSKLINGSVIYKDNRYYVYTNHKGLQYYKEEEVNKYLLSPYNQEWLEPLAKIEYTPKTGITYKGLTNIRKS